MSRTKALKNVKLTSFDDLFGGKVVEETAETGDVKEIPLSELHEFHNHPFQVRSDEELEEMIESVREHGVLERLIPLRRLLLRPVISWQSRSRLPSRIPEKCRP